MSVPSTGQPGDSGSSRLTDPGPLPGRAATLLRWLLVAIAVGVLASSLLLTSVASAPAALARAVEAGDASAGLRRVVDVVCVFYRTHTSSGTEIKSLSLGLGLAAVLVVGAAAWLLWGLGDRSPSGGSEPATGVQDDRFLRWLGRIGLVDVAQVLLVLVIVWSVLSRAWSPAPDLSIRATVIVAVQAAWALTLSRGLALVGRSGSTVRAIGVGLVLSCSLAGLLALRLRGFEEWPVEAFFPVGQAQSFSACMLAAAVLTLCWMAGFAPKAGEDSAKTGMGWWAVRVLGLGGLAGVLVLLAWAIVSSGSRAAWLGCGAGLIGLAWFALGRRGKAVLAPFALAGLIGACLWLHHFAYTRGTLESADVRLCDYGWRYALRAWAQSWGTGVGQAGYALTSELQMMDDLIHDPDALGVLWRGHAQNEWLEVLTDLGLVGFHLTIGVYVLTLIAGATALGRIGPGPARRWLIGLMAAMVGMMVEECLGCGLRLEPFPVVWYTVLAGIWALLLADRAEGSVWVPRWPARLVGGGAFVVVGVLVWHSAWRCFVGENALALAGQRVRSPRVAEAIGMTRLAMNRTLLPRHQARARLFAAQAHARLAAEPMSRVFRQAGRPDEGVQSQPPGQTGPAAQTGPSTPPPRALWADPSFRATWDQAERHLTAALRVLTELQAKLPGFPGGAALEADVCRTLTRLWRLRVELTERQTGLAFREAVDAMRGYQRREDAALVAALSREPFRDDLLVVLLRKSTKLPLTHVIDLLRLPLRNPLLPEEYRAVILQVSTSEGFAQAFQPFLERALQDAATSNEREWQDPFSPETLRIDAVILSAQGKIDQAIARLNQAVRLYEMAHYRLSVQQAATMGDLGWYRFVTDPTRPHLALEAYEQALEVCERPRRHPSVKPTYRRMIHVILATGNESAARELAPMLPQAGPAVDPNVLLAWSYEVLGRAFHQLAPDRRPPAWAGWVARAAELDPNAPDIQVLFALMSCERGEDRRAAASLERAWRQGVLPHQRQECVRTLLYALRKNPTSEVLKALHRRIEQKARAATQPARVPTSAPVRTSTAPA